MTKGKRWTRTSSEVEPEKELREYIRSQTQTDECNDIELNDTDNCCCYFHCRFTIPFTICC